MSLKEKAQQLSAVTKWKADQQLRILNFNSKISDLEHQVYTAKSQLADKTIAMFYKNELANTELVELCNVIKSLFDSIESLKIEKENAKNEKPPEGFYTAEIPQTQPENLICPICFAPLKGRFCPIHGVEGIPPSVTDEEKASRQVQLECPECKKRLEGRFCPVHGLEGVPVESEANELLIDNTEIENRKLVCPECGKELMGRFCPVHGKEGI